MALSLTIESASININRLKAAYNGLSILNELLYKKASTSPAPVTIVSQLNKNIKGDIKLSEALEVTLYKKGAQLCTIAKDKKEDTGKGIYY